LPETAKKTSVITMAAVSQETQLPESAEDETEVQSEEEEKEGTAAAEDKAADAVGTVALEDLERQYFLGLNERESLKKRLGETEEERNTLQVQVLKLQELNKKLTSDDNEAALLGEKLKTAEGKCTDAVERSDRMQVENDNLRKEIR
jgi:hypothetical protein